MVWPMVLLKVLPCKKNSRNRSTSNKDIAARGTSNAMGRHTVNIKKIELESQEVSSKIHHTEKKEAYSKGTSNFPTWDGLTVRKGQEKSPNICRVCLKEGDIPIFDTSSSENISDALAAFGGIEIKEDDAYPKYLCSYCQALLQGAILFRKTAQESDQILKKPPEHKQDHNVDILIDDEVYYSQNPALQYHCKRCDINFEMLREYNAHMLTGVHKAKRRKCPLCDKSLSDLYFKTHLQLHNLETPQSICDICGKTFSLKLQMKRHRATHFNEFPYKCDLCPYRGRFSECLKVHMRRHTGEKPFQCTECSFRVSNKSNLNKHMRTHKEKHDYSCEMCGRGFHTKRTLEVHLRIDHLGIKEHICNICGKAFGYRKQMMKHQLKVHKREKMSKGRLPLYLQVEQAKDNESET